MPDSFMARALGWLRAGYPAGVPGEDYVALLGILQRRLTDDEVVALADQLAEQSAGGAITPGDIRRMVTEQIHESAVPEDVQRVSVHLAQGGWPLAGKDDTDEEPSAGTFLWRVINWLRAGYPEGVPQHDYVPLLALLQRRLTKAEVKQVAKSLRRAGTSPATPEDVSAAIGRLIAQHPAEADMERVRAKLESKGWPVDWHTA